ncbi:hypothetical protein GOP47_0021782 [Adiantum capillus-veneris]|uniref:1-phosphatidylinositol-4-phosphate 5-kinase n=1 Tax=Adiantum capillus-veneris TaxID=13818 RepID=A0A9D4Z6W0_ADICA|nr:hypothetical protein GOP47_0021782 [Adiantum capillus-veneris]
MSDFGNQAIYHEPFHFFKQVEDRGGGPLDKHTIDFLANIDLTSGDVVEEKLLSNGDIYVGSLLGNFADGFGKYLWSDGCMYEGEWAKGKKTGRGKISWPSGATYEGDFMAGYIHGMGTYTAVNSSTYKGGWYMDEKKGFGTKSYANGDVYEGSWDQGLPDGYGRYVWKNGNEYVGDWKLGAMSGRGLLTWACGDKYDGQWLEGLEHGHGMYTWADGSSFEGTWAKGLKHGKGTFYPPRRSFSHSHLSVIDGQSGSGYEDTSFCNSPRRQSSCASDSEQCTQRMRMVSSHGSSVDKLTCSETLTDSSIGLGSSPSFDIGWEVNHTKEVEAEYDLENSVAARYHLVEQATYISSVVERDYVQGVLINELVKENAMLRAAKPLRRWQRRQSREPVKPGETILKGHQSYGLMINLQLGIRYTVGKITPEPIREITSADFGSRARIWMSFPREGSQLTPPHESLDFKWKDYCPMVFRHLRELFKIDSADYMLSVCGDSALRELSSPGKSGSVFYVSNDDRFMIKTMRKAEVKALLGMLQNYYDHVRMFENTLVAKFFGLHRIKPAGGQKVRFIVMGNMFCTELCIHRRFDLKGSSQGRSADKLEMDENTTLKDLDLDFVFRLEPSWRLALLRQIDNDCKFLENERIMDYSLLLGIHFRAPQFPAVFSSSPCQLPVLASREQVSGAASKGLFVVAHEPNKNSSSSGPHIRGSPLKTAASGNEEVDLLLPGTARLRIQLGVNMPARADRRPHVGRESYVKENQLEESYDVVLYMGIIDILQEYDMGKKLEHAYKSLHFDALAISAVDPSIAQHNSCNKALTLVQFLSSQSSVRGLNS